MRLSLVWTLLCAPLAAQPAWISLIGDDPLAAFSYVGNANGRMELAESADAEFPRAYRLTVSAMPADPKPSDEYGMRIRARGARAVAKGDLVVALYQMRCAASASGECVSRLNVERGADPWTKSYSTNFIAGPAWRRVAVAFTMAEDYAPGQYNVEFWMGQQVQTFEIGGIEIRHYGPGVQPAATGLDLRYEGAAEDAAWRVAAAERVQRYRKADLRVVVEDAEGNPLAGAKIFARMKRHEFCFGTAIAADQLLGASADSDRYRRAFLDLFNCAVFENDLKWPGWESNRQRALDGLRWMRDHGVARVRGHNLIWPGWQHLPSDLRSLAATPAVLRQRIFDHIAEAAGATRGWVTEWDVINEPYNNRDLQNILGDEEMVRWFQTAREADPYASMYVNDYSILSAGGGDFLHRNHYYKTISFLRENGAIVDGIGMQGHFSSPTPPELMLSILDRFALFGVPITITEFDYNSPDAAEQAQFTRDLMTVLFSHPAVDGFLMWGFWEGRHWKPDGAMIRRDWTAKPNYDAYRKLVFSDWWTSAEGEAGPDGSWRGRGFRGDYEIEAVFGGRKAVSAVTLSAEGATVTLRFDP